LNNVNNRKRLRSKFRLVYCEVHVITSTCSFIELLLAAEITDVI